MADSDKTAQEQAEIVLGYNQFEVKGETITVSEFLFVQELEALTIAEPIITEIAKLYIDGEDPDLIVIERVFATHKEAMIRLLSISTGKPIEWFNTLKGRDGNQLFLTFWGVNSHFFTQRIASRYVMENPGLLKQKADMSE